MKLGTALAILALAIVPAAAFAAEFNCSDRGSHAQSCAPGTAWDVNLQTCIKQVNS